MDWLRHFDPNPYWYFWCLHVVTLLSFPIFIISMICILRVNIVTNSTYKYLLGLNVTMSYVTQLSLSEGTMPVLILPIPGGYPTVQCLMIGNGLSTTGLFFFRSHMASPFSRLQFYGIIWIFVLGSILIPLIMNISLCEFMETKRAVRAVQTIYPDIYPLLPDRVLNETLIVPPNIISVHVIYSYFGCLMIACVSLIICVNYRATVLLRRQIFSQTTVTMHKILVRCLVIQTAVYYSLFSIPVIIILTIVGIKLNLPTAANLAFIVLSLSDSASSLALILGHRRYRKAVLRPFKKEKSVDISNIGGRKRPSS